MSKTAFMFTGQGSQYVGMGKDLYEGEPAAREVFQRADEALGFSISRLCFEGPEEELGITTNTQPAILTHSYAAFLALGIVPDLGAGHSLGEYTALTAAGVLRFEDAVRLVRKRGEVMNTAMPPGAGGMAALRKMTIEETREALAGSESGKIEIANLNTHQQIVVSGEMAAIRELEQKLGSRQVFVLAVSAPFHSSLMKPAMEAFTPFLEETEFQDPRFPIYSNVDAKKISTAIEARDALKRQICGSVLWQTGIEKMILEDGAETFVELGPKKALHGMAGVIAKNVGRDVRCLRVDTMENLAETREALGKV